MQTLFFNGNIYSMDSSNNKYSTLLVEDGKIVDLFKSNPNLSDMPKIDFKNAYVYPGFIDTHTHSFEGGLYSLGTNLSNISTLSQLFEKISSTETISGTILGYQFDETQIVEKRFPSIAELDKIFPNTPVIIRRVDGHSCVINSSAIKQIPWNQTIPNGFNGLLNKGQDSFALKWFHQSIDKETVISAYMSASKIAAANGHTTIHTMVGDGKNDPTHFELMDSINKACDIEFIPYAQIDNIEKAKQLGARIVGGCILSDGSIGSKTAALLDPYTGDKQFKGSLYKTDQYWFEKISKAHNLDIPIAIHAIGDAATRQIARIFLQVQKETPKQHLQHQIVHAIITDDSTLDMLVKANVCCTIQPAFDYHWGGKSGLYMEKIGPDRLEMSNRFKTMKEKGLLIAASSDWYVTDLNPLIGIEGLINHHNPKQRIESLEAIEMYTTNAAKISGDEKRIGKLKKGMDADFTCLNQDLFCCKEILSSNVTQVIKQGKIISNLV